MSIKAPIFPMPQPQHFNDYGFDTQFDYFQVLEEARKHKRESRTSIDSSIHFKLQKPISKDESKPKKAHHHHHYINKSKKKRKWWRNALFLFKWKWVQSVIKDEIDVHQARARVFRGSSISGPVYVTESRSGSSNPPCNGTRNRASSSGPLPYLSLRELNMEHQHMISTSNSPSPIYLVT
ncbi:uncharacterized protein [Rutidosis leptorrhynchoides]|uniref:uncharacterized protein n=1 Tax=Rutidosis leptorrhynchoides TaxID=125765 RepID=UPI003A9A5E92